MKRGEDYLIELGKLYELYELYGYKKFKMSKFEEYDLYLRNKSFLQDEYIIAFNDKSGRMLALKPDITISIVKNLREKELPEKVYYAENVYRTEKGSSDIKEIMQVGAEHIGELDTYSESEMILLAVRSLQSISPDYLMGISHMGIISGILDKTELTPSGRKRLLGYIESKSEHDIREFCSTEGIDDSIREKLVSLIKIYGPLSEAFPAIYELILDEGMRAAAEELYMIGEILEKVGAGDRLVIDFSIMNDLNYYNGIIFQGFIDGLAENILSGGRYDNLLERLGKGSVNAEGKGRGAIGFALYPELLERYRKGDKNGDSEQYDADILLLYSESDEDYTLAEEVMKLTESGKRVRAEKKIPNNRRFEKVLRLSRNKEGNIELEEVSL